jgi:hypothetical protein
MGKFSIKNKQPPTFASDPLGKAFQACVVAVVRAGRAGDEQKRAFFYLELAEGYARSAKERTRIDDGTEVRYAPGGVG